MIRGKADAPIRPKDAMPGQFCVVWGAAQRGHRDTSGVLVPGTLADVDEVVMIAKAVAEGGGGMFEMAADFACCAPALFSSF